MDCAVGVFLQELTAIAPIVIPEATYVGRIGKLELFMDPEEPEVPGRSVHARGIGGFWRDN